MSSSALGLVGDRQRHARIATSPAAPRLPLSGPFSVGEWAVEPSLNRLSCGETTVRVRPQLMDVLVCLASANGRTVTRQSVFETVWSNRFVSESVLSRSVAELRRAFGDAADRPRIIETISKRGYRIIAPIVPRQAVQPGEESPCRLPETTRHRPEGGQMDRKEFLKSACGLGACGCALHFLGVSEPVQAAVAAPEQPDQRLAFARYQIAKMVGFMAAAGPAAPACAEVLQKTGRECAKLGQLGAKFKGDPDAYFAAARKAWGTEFSWDKEKGIVTVAVADGECSCPLVDSKRTPIFFCNCSVGYQHQAFEEIFGKPVQVSLKESKLGGSKRCVFEVRLS